VRILALLLALTTTASAETPKQRAERLMTAMVRTVLPKWYEPVSRIRCVSYCKDGITSSTFELEATDTNTGKLEYLAIYCDDVPDKHQCGWGLRRH
jgi:hypothetical protein